MLNPGDGLFLYTDGVTEAMNAAGEIFSTDRLKDVLATCADGDVSGITACVGGAINDFCKDASQYDDITMMAVRYEGTGSENG